MNECSPSKQLIKHKVASCKEQRAWKRKRHQERLLAAKRDLDKKQLVSSPIIRGYFEELESMKSSENVATWSAKVLDEVLFNQVKLYNHLERECADLLKYAHVTSKRNEILDLCKMNGLFLLETLPKFMRINDDSPPCFVTEREPKRRNLYEGMLKACMNIFSIKTGCISAKASVDEILNWRPELNFSPTQVEFRTCRIDDEQKYVTILIRNYPVAPDLLKKVFRLIDPYSLGMMGSQAARAYVAENRCKSDDFHTVGHASAILPINLHGVSVETSVFDLQLTRPVQHQFEDLAFITASDECDGDFFIFQSVMPQFDADLEGMEADGACFMRGISVSKGDARDGEETSNIRLLLGLKRPKLGEKESVRQFYHVLNLIGARHFMDAEMHVPDKVIYSFEAVLKTTLFVYDLMQDKP